MIHKDCIWLGLLFLVQGCFTGSVQAEAALSPPQRMRMQITVAGQRLEYLLYTPVQGLNRAQRPLVLFLHGAGERGDQASGTTLHGPMKHRHESEALRSSYILVPQCPADGWWQSETLMHLLQSIINDHRYGVDPRRIYVTGLSMGGYGTWNLLSHYPEFFAAAVPVCGGGDVKSLTIALKIDKPPIFNKTRLSKAVQVAVWAFHGDKDKAVPFEQSVELTRLLRKSGNRTVKLTAYKGVGHDAWSATYANPSLYEWMFKQRRPPIGDAIAPTHSP
jgi:predicted peptidase